MVNIALLYLEKIYALWGVLTKLSTLTLIIQKM